MNEPDEFKPEVSPGTGILLIFAGLISTGYFVIYPIWQVQHQAPKISYSMEGSVAGVLLIFLGVFMLIAPEKYTALLKLDKNNLKLKDILVMGGLAIFGLGVVVAMDLYFKSMGYH